MTPLSQQLEDKKEALLELEKNGIKKEGYACGEDFTYWEFPSENQKIFHYVLEAEIAILEQAIAEIKKQRESSLKAKEILEEFKDRICKVAFTEDRIKNIGIRITAYEVLKEQLNQLKEEQ